MQNLKLNTPIWGKFRGKIKILSTSTLSEICSVCHKIAVQLTFSNRWCCWLMS